MRHFLIEAGDWVLITVWLFLFVPAIGHTASSIWASPPLTRLIEEGIAQNKEIKGLEARLASLKDEIPFAGSLDDLRLGLGIMNLPTDTFSFDQEAMTQKQVFIAQKFPWFGKLDLKSQRATLKAMRQKAVLKAKRLELARKIAVFYYELGFVTTSMEINKRLTETVSQLLTVAETRYATGRGLQQDVLQAQVELSKLLDENIKLEGMYRVLEDQINELLNRESFTPIQPPKSLSYPDFQLQVKDLQDRALKENPLLRVRQAEINIAMVEIQLARKNYWPDIDFKLAYGQREEDLMGRGLADLVSASVTMNLPLWQEKRQDPKLAATKNGHQAAIYLYQNLVKSLPYRVDALATEIRDTQKNYRLFSDALLIQAEQWARSSLLAYEVGSVEFNTMIVAQIRLLRFELQAESYIYKIYQKGEELKEIVGGPLQPEHFMKK
ncbi:MAG: TolC family protein [Desulfobulbaceae bacterium]|nr:TolC family protein [Desulfobulbaceae bacterium]